MTIFLAVSAAALSLSLANRRMYEADLTRTTLNQNMRAGMDFLATDIAQGITFGEFNFREPEAHALDPFRHLDLGAAYTQPLGPVALQVRVNVLNATNRLNVADKSLLETDLDDDIALIEQERYLLPRTLSMSVRLKW